MLHLINIQLIAEKLFGGSVLSVAMNTKLHQIDDRSAQDVANALTNAFGKSDARILK